MSKVETTERDKVINEIANAFECVVNGNSFPKDVCPKVRKLVRGILNELEVPYDQ